MKIGGMGIQLMDKDGKVLESHLYIGITGWRYSRSEQHLVIELGKQAESTGKEIILGGPPLEPTGIFVRCLSVFLRLFRLPLD